MKKSVLIFCLIHIACIGYSSIQDTLSRELKRLENEYTKYTAKGDFIKAESTIKLFNQYKLNDFQKGREYTRLAEVYYYLGRFDDVIKYCKLIENLQLTESEKKRMLPFAYTVEAAVFEKRRSYLQAIEFTEKAIRIYKTALSSDKKYFLESLAAAYQNMGSYYNEMGQYKKALEYFAINLKIKNDNGFLNKGMTLSSFAKCYVGLKNMIQADSYFRMSIETAIEEFGNDYYRLPELYFNYGEFLQSNGSMREASSLFSNGLSRCLELYGQKHIQTSRAYGFLAKNHLLSGNADSAVYYYQKSLISIVKDFNDNDIAKNPKIDSSILEVRLMENLKGKSMALDMLAEQQNAEEKMKTLNLSLGTIALTLDLIDVIRNNYPSEETKLYISGNEKETYISALRIASKILSLFDNDVSMKRMYDIAVRAKAAILRNQITGNNLLFSSSLPALIREKYLNLIANIASYNKLVLDESGKESPDTSKINAWKDALFELNKTKEELADSISMYIPQYTELLKKTNTVSAATVQSRLENDEVVLDYFISKKYTEGKRKLYTFIVSRDDLNVIESEVDSLFEKNTESLLGNINPDSRKSNNAALISSLHYFYTELIQPAESFINGKRLIIIPDEEISRLPFEAFITEIPSGEKNDFDGLHFLINDYTISHAYSASLLPDRPVRSGKKKVYSFSPSYGSGSGYDSLGGAIKEIQNVSSLMGGKSFTFEKATRSNFLNTINDPVLFHLAMHSVQDSVNSLYSYLQFEGENKDDKDARLYNYEVSLSKINSPLIVLSSCNSGTGNLYSGEGQMSLARSFILAGASSVVRTAWEVNDDSGSDIITRFYSYLSEGVSKDKALQLAKLDFINNSTPAFRDPYYWAAYEILGDNDPVSKNNRIVTFVTILLALSLAGLFFYFRRRMISSAFSR